MKMTIWQNRREIEHKNRKGSIHNIYTSTISSFVSKQSLYCSFLEFKIFFLHCNFSVPNTQFYLGTTLLSMRQERGGFEIFCMERKNLGVFLSLRGSDSKPPLPGYPLAMRHIPHYNWNERMQNLHFGASRRNFAWNFWLHSWEFR